MSLVEILIASDIVIDFREGDLNVYHHFAQEILWEGPENMHREWCCTISCKGRSSWLLDFEKRCTSGMPTVMRHEQVLYSRIVCLLCDSETLGGKGAQPAGGLCLSETKMRK